MRRDEDGLLENFRSETKEHLETLSRALAALETDPNDPEMLQDAMRVLHSLKGTARMVGAQSIARLAHSLESLVVVGRSSGARLALALPALCQTASSLHDDLAAFLNGDGLAVDARIAQLELLGSSLRGEIENILPAIDRQVLDVLSEHQRARLFDVLERGLSVREVCVTIDDEARFAERMDQIEAGLRRHGELICTAGLTPDVDGSLRFKFLVAVASAEALQGWAGPLGVQLGDPQEKTQRPEPAMLQGGALDDAALDEELDDALELLKLQFVSEKLGELDGLSAMLLRLNDHEEVEQELIDELFRTAHNIKGAAGTFGLDEIAILSHHLESVLDKLRKRSLKPDPELVDLLLRTVDSLTILFQAAHAGSSPSPDALAIVDSYLALENAGAIPRPAERGQSAARGPVLGAADSVRVRLDKIDDLVSQAEELTLLQNARERHIQLLLSLERDLQSLLMDQHRAEDPTARTGLSRHNGTARLARCADALYRLTEGIGESTRLSSQIVAALQRAVFRLRMLPLHTLFDTAPRLVHSLARETGKQARLVCERTDAELDKNLLEHMTAPLMHLLRNAVDHGLETPEERTQSGKPAVATIVLEAYQQADRVVIALQDDGRGIDPSKVRERAVRLGMLSEDEARTLDTRESLELIFRPGFSTALRVTDISGRGVGMDVVKKHLEALAGTISISSDVGRGTRFELSLPLAVSAVPALTIRCSGQTLCVQTSAIQEIVRVRREEVELEGGCPCFMFRNKTLPLVRLRDLLELPEPAQVDPPLLEVIVCRARPPIGLVVDKVERELPIIVKKLQGLLSRTPSMAGATILPDGRVALVLDVAALITRALSEPPSWELSAAAQATAPENRQLLVVDDSLTTRELLRSVLTSFGFSVETAANGEEAWELLLHRPFALVVSDINMPVLDGLELTKRIKSMRKPPPVVLVSSLGSSDEQLAGLHAGADAYIAKGAFDQNSLIEHVQALLV